MFCFWSYHERNITQVFKYFIYHPFSFISRQVFQLGQFIVTTNNDVIFGRIIQLPELTKNLLIWFYVF